MAKAPKKLIGTNDVDLFPGTNKDDIYFGQGGDDILKGLDGDDNCNGGTGKDLVDGGRGNDTVNGGAGDDTLNGGDGNDTITGAAGKDKISGGNGDDTVDGGSGDDNISGNAGNDNLSGGSGNDRLRGNSGNDVIAGNTGNDRMLGGSGDDLLIWNNGDGNDAISGNDGRDTVLVNGSGLQGDNFVLGKNAQNKAFFERTGLDGQAVDLFNLVVDTSEVFNVVGGGGNDTFTVKDLTGAGVELIQFDGGEGNDSLNAQETAIQISAQGGAGDDTLIGSSANDTLDGGDGNDVVVGAKGDDRMIGGAGDDVLAWADGDGNDIMSGNDGRDTIAVQGALAKGDNFVLGKNAAGKAFFERNGLDGQPVNATNGGFTLTVDTSEVFNVLGEGGNDTFVINDLANTGVEVIQFAGGEGNDSVDASKSSTRLIADGGAGDDILTGGTGTITVTNANNIAVTTGDTMTGGLGKDQFRFLNDPFANGNPAQNLNQPDVVTDFEQGQAKDQLVFGGQAFGLNELKFLKGDVKQLSGDSNLLILEGEFANAGLAAAAIRDNNNITAGRGVFVYFNNTLGFSRAVFSTDLANGGPFSVQANMTNLGSSALQANFVKENFALA
ncbi:MAG: calcium-binding protein [Cyanobacteria bacterium RM1_2_2]|nr:calcium-binding protein [Cyanobacteria bacterium RM1_2_2]